MRIWVSSMALAMSRAKIRKQVRGKLTRTKRVLFKQIRVENRDAFNQAMTQVLLPLLDLADVTEHIKEEAESLEDRELVRRWRRDREFGT